MSSAKDPKCHYPDCPQQPINDYCKQHDPTPQATKPVDKLCPHLQRLYRAAHTDGWAHIPVGQNTVHIDNADRAIKAVISNQVASAVKEAEQDLALRVLLLASYDDPDSIMSVRAFIDDTLNGVTKDE